jgi:hypothetical protein
MPKILAFLTFVLVLLVAHGALACEGSDRRVGPLCIERTIYQAGALNVSEEVARFEDDENHVEVWRGEGYVDSATRTKMDVIQKRFVKGRGMTDVHVIYVWNGKEFVEKKSRRR